MKRTIITFIIIVLAILNSFGQTFEKKFLGDDYMLYKGAFLKLIDNPISGFNYTFYADLKYCQETFDKNVLYPDAKYSFKTNPDKLANRVFKVEDIIGKDGKAFSGSTYSLDKPIFILKDTNSKEVIYFKYDRKYDFNFPFLVSKIEVSTNTLCEDISRTVDDFTDEIKMNSPIIDKGKISSVIIYKNINKTNTAYYLSLHTIGNTLNVGESGSIILFDDGTKINKGGKIDVEAEDDGWEYSAFITLTESDLKILSTKKISKFRLYIYDELVDQWLAEKFVDYVKCIMEKK